jgi:hypothetical protein
MGKASDDWAKELDADWEQEMAAVRTDFVDLVQTGVDRIVDRSPVKTGQFKANWSVSIGAPGGEVTKARDKDGTETKQRARAVMAGYPEAGEFPTVYIENNLDYATDLEHGRSDQAPQGMAALTSIELAAMWEARNK